MHGEPDISRWTNERERRWGMVGEYCTWTSWVGETQNVNGHLRVPPIKDKVCSMGGDFGQILSIVEKAKAAEISSKWRWQLVVLGQRDVYTAYNDESMYLDSSRDKHIPWCTQGLPILH